MTCIKRGFSNFTVNCLSRLQDSLTGLKIFVNLLSYGNCFLKIERKYFKFFFLLDHFQEFISSLKGKSPYENSINHIKVFLVFPHYSKF